MGVRATYCAICGLPVQHDHYVASERENFLAIYRTDNRPDGHFPFMPGHDWLLRGVAVSPDDGPYYGSCCDGGLMAEDGTEYYVGQDSDEYTAMHVYCWQAAGKPLDYNAMAHYKQAPGNALVAPYQEQLFEFARCVEEGNDWLLLDPSLPSGARNKARIDSILAMTPPSNR